MDLPGTISGHLIPVLIISLALAIIIAMSAFYFRTATENLNLERLKVMSKTYFLGNATALRPYQKAIITNPYDWSEYNDCLEETAVVREHVLGPLILCIFTVFSLSFIIFIAFEWGYYRDPTMILGGGLEVGPQAQACLERTSSRGGGVTYVFNGDASPRAADAPASCEPGIRDAVARYQLGSLEVIQFAFLAAYVWALWQLFQRMVSRDVTVYAFHVITIRLVTTIVLALTIFQLFSGTEPTLPATGAEEGAAPSNDLDKGIVAEFTTYDVFILIAFVIGVFILIAFVIGFFPEVGLRWLAEKGLRVLRTGPKSTYLDIERIEGVDTFTRARLAEVGVVDASSLAASNPVTLAIRTPFPLPQLVDWVGQAQLLVLVKDTAFDKLRVRGIRTSVQFYNQFCGAAACPAGPPAADPALPPAAAADPAVPPAAAPGPVVPPGGPNATSGLDDEHSACASLKADPSFARLKELVDRMLLTPGKLPQIQ